MPRVAGKIAVVTGAGAGIGRATVLALAREGADTVATDIDLVAAERTALEAGKLGRQALALDHDAGDESHWQRVIEATLSRFGRIDVLVNNAGIGPTKSLLETSLADWRAVMRVNLDGVFLGTRIALDAMRETADRPRKSSGSIINMSSVLGQVGLAETAPYCASKAGVRLLTKAAALESAAKGWSVRVNSVHPGFIWTPMLQAGVERMAVQAGSTPEAMKSAIAALHPLGRMGEAEEVAAAILYLASDESAFVTGSELTIDGGYTAH